MTKWYFIIFKHQYYSKTRNTAQEWVTSETIENIHPLEFLLGQRTKYGEDSHATYMYKLVFWAEIPEEIALKFKEKIE